MAADPRIFIPLEAFLEELRAYGFPVGVNTYIEVQQILDKIAPGTPATQVKTLLAPIFVRNPQEQDKFYRLFDRYLAAYSDISPVITLETPETREQEKRKQILKRLWGNMLKWLGNRWLLLALTLIVTAFWIIVPIQLYRSYQGTETKLGAKEYITAFRLDRKGRYPNQVISFLWRDLTGQAQPCDSLEGLAITYVVKQEGKGFSLQLGSNYEAPDRWYRWTIRKTDHKAQQATPTITLADTGTYIVALAASNAYGCVATDEVPIRIDYPKTCEAGFSYTLTSESPKTVIFSDTSHFAQNDVITSWEWEIDDKNAVGKKISGESVDYTFSDFQAYQVCLTITTEEGCKDTHCSIITLKDETETATLLPVAMKPQAYVSLQTLDTTPFAPYYPIAGVIFIFVAGFFYEVFRQTRRMSARQRTRNQQGPFTWPLSNPQPFPIFSDQVIFNIAKHLRRRQKSDIYELDVIGSLEATLDAGGYPTFEYQAGTRPAEYLVLIEQRSPRDHVAAYYQQLVETIGNQDVYIDRYFYPDSFHYFHRPEEEQPVYLSDLRLRHPDHTLIILGDGDGLIDFYSSEFLPTYFELAQWPKRLIMTPSDALDWGFQEVNLAKHFVVVPGKQVLFTQLVDLLEADKAPRLSTWRELGDQPLLSREDSNDLEELRFYLGDPLFEWLASCAIHPELHWDLTMALGNMVLGRFPTEADIFRLCRLPFFRMGLMPDDLRIRLADTLDFETLQQTRQVIVDMLQHNPPPIGSVASDRVEVQVATKKWEMAHAWQDKLKQDEQVLEYLEREELEDPLVMQSFQQNRGALFRIPLRQSFRNFVFRKGIPALGMKSWIRFGLVGSIMLSLLFMLYGRQIQQIGSLAEFRTWLKQPSNVVSVDGHYYRLNTGRDSALYYSHLGDEFYRKGDYGSAFNEYAQAIYKQPFNPTYYYQRGLANYQLVRSERQDSLLNLVGADFERAFRLSPLLAGDQSFELTAHDPRSYPRATHLAYSQDGKLMAYATGTSVLLTSVGKGSTATLPHPQPIKSLCFSPDQRWLLVATGDQVYVWRADGIGKPLVKPGNTLSGHTGDINAIACSSDGEYFATASADSLGIIWSINASRQQIQPLYYLENIHTDEVIDVAFSPDGKRVLTTSADSTIAIWEMATGSFYQELRIKGRAFKQASFLLDQHTVIACDQKGFLTLWDLAEDYRSSIPIVNGQIQYMTLSPDRNLVGLIAQKTDDQTLLFQVWDPFRRRMLAEASLTDLLPYLYPETSDYSQSDVPTRYPGISFFQDTSLKMAAFLPGQGWQSFAFPRFQQWSMLGRKAYFNQAVVAYERSQFETANQQYHQLLQLQPLDTAAYYGRSLARFYQLKNQVPGVPFNELPDEQISYLFLDALEDLNQAAKLDPMYGDSTKRLVPLIFDLFNQYDIIRNFQPQVCEVLDRYDEGACALFRNYDEIQPYHEGLAGVREGKLWGYVDTSRNLVIGLHYRDVGPFKNGLAAVLPPSGKFYELIDSSGKAIYGRLGDVGSGLRPVYSFERKAYGYVSEKTHLVMIDPQFSQAGTFHRGYAKVSQNRKWGFIDTDGKPSFGGIVYDKIQGDFSKNTVVNATRNRRSIQIDYRTPEPLIAEDKKSENKSLPSPPAPAPAPKTSTSSTPNEIVPIGPVVEGRQRAIKNGRYGYLDAHAKTKKQIYHTVRAGETLYTISDRYGVSVTEIMRYNQMGSTDPLYQPKLKTGQRLALEIWTNKVVISFQYLAAKDFSLGRAAVKQTDGKWGFIDASGKKTTGFIFDRVESYNRTLGQATAKVWQGSIPYYVDLTGNCVEAGGLQCPTSSAKSKRPSEATSSYTDKANGLSIFQVGRRYGLRKADGSLIFEPTYFNAFRYSEGLAAVKNQAGQWGYIQTNGALTIPVSFENASPFSEGLAAVQRKGLWGYIDQSGKVVIDFQYTEAREFTSGNAIVKRGKLFYRINRSGKLVGANRKSKGY